MGRWYVYVIRDAGGVVLYVGKGAGKRSAVSQRRHGGSVEIARRFKRETAALRYERKLIAAFAPLNNLSAGGEGRSYKRERNWALIWMSEAEARAVKWPTVLNLLIRDAYRKCQENQRAEA